MTQTTNVIPEEAHLFYKQGSSDKVYSLCMAQCETGWTVLATWGRRGSTLSVEAKIERAEYEAAKKIYDRVLREKLAKGYKPVEEEATTKKEPATTRRPVSKDVLFSAELLTRIDEREALAYMRNPRYWFQLKRDGVRLTISAEKIDKTFDIFGYNKLGQRVQLDPALYKAVEALCDLYNVKQLLMDGEWESSGYHAWDLLEMNSDLRDFEYQYRFETLETLLKDVRKMFYLVRCAKTTTEKEILVGKAKVNRAEGICVKDIRARYCGGRNGQHLKWKFESTGSFIVGPKPKRKANDGHRSVALYIVDKKPGGERWASGADFAKPFGLRFVATVKIADKYEVPLIGAIAEIRYLYAHPGGGIVQPCYFGVTRKDVRMEDCVAEQLRYKQESEEAAA